MSSSSLPGGTTSGAIGGAGAAQSITDSSGGTLNSSTTGGALNSNVRNSGAGGTPGAYPNVDSRSRFNAQNNLTGRGDINAQQEARPGDDRMTFYNGEWWFYSPNSTWMYYRGNQWYPYSAQQFMPNNSYTAGYRGVLSQGGVSAGTYTDENGRRYRRDYTPDAAIFRNQTGSQTGANSMAAPGQTGVNQMTAPSQTGQTGANSMTMPSSQMGTSGQMSPAIPSGAATQTPAPTTFDSNRLPGPPVPTP